MPKVKTRKKRRVRNKALTTCPDCGVPVATWKLESGVHTCPRGMQHAKEVQKHKRRVERRKHH